MICKQYLTLAEMLGDPFCDMINFFTWGLFINLSFHTGAFTLKHHSTQEVTQEWGKQTQLEKGTDGFDPYTWTLNKETGRLDTEYLNDAKRRPSWLGSAAKHNEAPQRGAGPGKLPTSLCHSGLQYW